MSDYSSNFPTQSPTFAFDAKAGKLDSRISYSRSSSGTAFSSEKHLSSLNLLTNSEDFSAWTKTAYVSVSANAAASPSGTTTADKITVSSTSIYPWTYQAIGVTSGASDTVVFSVYLKMDGWRYVLLAPSNQSGEGVWFDLQSGAVGTESAGSTGTITAIGSSGWYRCSVERTGSMTAQALVSLVDADNSQTGTAGGTNGVLVWGGQLTDQFSEVTNYNATTTQIHREFAPTLKTSAANEPRFEYAADGQSVAKGLLIEAQKSNLALNSNDFTNATWNKQRVTVTPSASIGPDGQLSASLIAENTDTTTIHFMLPTAAITSGYSVGTDKSTHSVFAKYAGRNLRMTDGYNPADGGSTIFDLQNGTVVSGGGSIQSCGNGWYRCSVTMTMSASTLLLPYIQLVDGTTWPNASDAGDGYSGILLFGCQTEQQSMSSYITTGSSTVTKSADSCSVADFGYTGGPVSVIAEANMTSPTTETSQKSVFELGDGTSDNRIWVYNNFGKADSLYVRADGVTGMFEAGTVTTDDDFAVAVRVDTNNAGRSTNGGSVTSDTSVVMPSGLDTLYIGRSKSTSVNALNGHIKRLSLYSVALSDVELQSLTSNP